MQLKKWSVLVVSAAIMGGVAISPAFAQGGGPGNGFGPGAGFGRGSTICSTTNYTDVAAQALGITGSELRVALVGGKSISDLATSKNITVQTVTDAITTAQKADLAQAVKDGLLTQAQADAMSSRQNPSVPPAPPAANPPATEQAPAPAPRAPRILRGAFELRVPELNVVHRETVIAQALGMSCPDLAKAMISGQTITQVAASKNVQMQTVIDALINAEKAAIAQDVKEGLITQTQADGRIVRLTTEIPQMLNNQRQRPGFGFGGNRPNQGGSQLPGGAQGQPPAPGNEPGQPPAAATPSVSS
ncbi:MAG: hypothetical protein ABI947_12925 [Chloroflexota bacterium]